MFNYYLFVQLACIPEVTFVISVLVIADVLTTLSCRCFNTV